METKEIESAKEKETQKSLEMNQFKNNNGNPDGLTQPHPKHVHHLHLPETTDGLPVHSILRERNEEETMAYIWLDDVVERMRETELFPSSDDSLTGKDLVDWVILQFSIQLRVQAVKIVERLLDRRILKFSGYLLDSDYLHGPPTNPSGMTRKRTNSLSRIGKETIDHEGISYSFNEPFTNLVKNKNLFGNNNNNNGNNESGDEEEKETPVRFVV